MKKLLVMFAVISLTAVSALAAPGKGEDPNHETNKTKEQKKEDAKKAEEAGSTGATAAKDAILKSSQNLVVSKGEGIVGNVDGETAAQSISSYISNGKISQARVDQLAKGTDADSKNFGEALVLASAAGDGEGIAIFNEKELGSTSKWSEKAKDKRTSVGAKLITNLKAKMPTKEALIDALKSAGFDENTVKQILEVCFGIK